MVKSFSEHPRSAPALLTCIGVLAVSVSANAQTLSFTVPRNATSFSVAGQPVSITTVGRLTGLSRDAGQTVFSLQLTADLADLQTNLTPLLGSQLDRSDPCGDRIAVQRATMVPLAPAAIVTLDVHFERWACAKVLGKSRRTKVIGGNGEIQLKLVPGIADRATVSLMASIESVRAEGPLGDLLRTEPIASMIREKVTNALRDALQNGLRLTAALPAAAQPFATLERVDFRDAGGARLAVGVDGELRVPDSLIAGLFSELTPH